MQANISSSLWLQKKKILQVTATIQSEITRPSLFLVLGINLLAAKF